MLKYEPCIKDKEPRDKEQKIETDFFYFYALKNFHLKFFHKFLIKGNTLEDHKK